MPAIIPYIRFSTAEQAAGSSRDRQMEKVAEWLAANPEYTLSSAYEDLGRSGHDGSHIAEGALGELLKAIKDGAVPAGSIILVEALDRFSRMQPLDILPHVQTIIRADVSLITLEDNQKYDRASLNGDALLLFVMKVRAAFEYSQRLGDRIARSYNKRATKAKEGETIKRRNGFWLTSDGKLIEGAKDVVLAVFRRYVDGASIRSLARDYPEYLKNTASVRHVLRNPAAMGSWQRYKTSKVNGKQQNEATELIENVFEAAVEPALFYQAQALLDKEKRQGVTVARKVPLAGLVVCGECGGNFVMLQAGKNCVTDRMRCYHRTFNKESCSNSKTIPMPVLNFLFTTTADAHMRLAYQRTRLPEARRLRVTLEGKLATVKTALRGLVSMREADPDDLELLERYQSRVEERKKLEAELANVPDTAEDVKFDGTGYMKFLRSDIFARCKVLQMDGYRITCGKDGLITAGVKDSDQPLYTVQYVGYVRKTDHWEVNVVGGRPVAIHGRGSLVPKGKRRIGEPADPSPEQ